MEQKEPVGYENNTRTDYIALLKGFSIRYAIWCGSREMFDFGPILGKTTTITRSSAETLGATSPLEQVWSQSGWVDKTQPNKTCSIQPKRLKKLTGRSWKFKQQTCFLPISACFLSGALFRRNARWFQASCGQNKAVQRNCGCDVPCKNMVLESEVWRTCTRTVRTLRKGISWKLAETIVFRILPGSSPSWVFIFNNAGNLMLSAAVVCNLRTRTVAFRIDRLRLLFTPV